MVVFHSEGLFVSSSWIGVAPACYQKGFLCLPLGSGSLQLAIIWCSR